MQSSISSPKQNLQELGHILHEEFFVSPKLSK